MKKIFLTIVMLSICQVVQADLILLKNGKVFEGKIVQIRGIFVRILDNYGSPFKEFLIEDIVNIEQSSPDEVSQLTIRNIHQRAINRAQSGKIQEAVDKRATELLEAAIITSPVTSLKEASDEVRGFAREKASAIIGEAVRIAETPRLDQISLETKSIAEEKAGILIEEAVRIVKVSPLKNAPDVVQVAAYQVADALVSEAAIDARMQRSANGKDQIIGALVIVLLLLLLREKRNKKKASDTKSDQALTSSLRDIDEELKKFDQKLGQKESSEEENEGWIEKREYKRVPWNFPICLNADELNPVFAMVKNISIGGAYAVCNDVNLLRSLGDRLQFKFSSKDKNFPINGKVQVVRIRSNRGLGLKFFDLDQSSVNHLCSLS